MPEVTDEFQTNRSVLEIKRESRSRGYFVPDISIESFFRGVQKLFPHNPNLPELQSEILDNIHSRDPHFLDDHPLFKEPMTKQRIRALYGHRKDLIELKGSADKVFDAVTHAFQVRMKHIQYHMIDKPHPKELAYTIQQAEEILDGNWDPTR